MRILKISKVNTVLVGLMMMAILLCCSSKVQADQSGDYTYTVTNGKAEITRYSGGGGDVTVPSALGGFPVTSTGDYAFAKCTTLKSITLPKGFKSIGYATFAYCTDLTSVNLPQDLTSIDEFAFENCSALKSITLPQGIIKINVGTFGDCSNLTSIIIPQGVTIIEYYAFGNCSSLKSVSLPQGLTYIGKYAFGFCTSLTSINFPQELTSIGDAAFNSTDLTTINLPQGLTSIDKLAFGGCKRLTSIKFNSATTIIYDDEYTIPASAKIIGYDPSTAKDYAQEYNRKFEVIGSDVTVTGVSLNIKTTTINVGASKTLSATISPTNATNKDVTWDSSDTSIATVDSNGKVTGVSAGKATISVTTVDGKKTATCKVTVKAVKVTKVSLNKKTTSINVGENETLIATIAPTNATNQNVTWKSSNKAIATVDSNGNVVGVKAGTAIISVTAVDGKKTATCKVTIIK